MVIGAVKLYGALFALFLSAIGSLVVLVGSFYLAATGALAPAAAAVVVSSMLLVITSIIAVWFTE